MESNVDSPVQQCPGKPPAKDPIDPKKKWIKFLVKDNDGKPMENVQLNVILPDGSREECVTDKDGMIEIYNLEDGDCKLDTDWRRLHVKRTVHI
jgi:hypothetical protein